MSASSPSTVEAIILKTRAYGNADRLLDVLCARHGLMTLVARGARRSRRRFAGTLELFVQGDFDVQFKPDKEVKSLVAVENCKLRMGIRRCLQRIARASAICAMARAVCPPGQPAPEVFSWLSLALDYLEQGKLARSAGFYAYCLQHAGLMPDLATCTRCHKAELVPDRLALDGLACSMCAPNLKPLTSRVYQGLRGARIDDDDVANTVEKIALQWLRLQIPAVCSGVSGRESVFKYEVTRL